MNMSKKREIIKNNEQSIIIIFLLINKQFYIKKDFKKNY